MNQTNKEEKLKNTIINRSHFNGESSYQTWLRGALKLGYKNVDEFIKDKYFYSKLNQEETAALVKSQGTILSRVLEKADLRGIKKIVNKEGGRKKGYKIGKIERKTPNTNPQTKKWYNCTNCGKKTRNRLLCDYCYTNADKITEHCDDEEYKVNTDYNY